MILNRVAGHALVLEDAGDWCPPSCTARCGRIVLAQNSTSDQITQCFRDDCGCSLPSQEPISRDLFKKYQDDVRVENLLL